jgi:hypothetical protein
MNIGGISVLPRRAKGIARIRKTHLSLWIITGGGKMKNSVSIDDITNGLLTIQKVKQLYSKDHRAFEDGSGQSVLPDRLSLMREIITSISRFMPQQTRGGTFSSAFEQGIRFSNAYRELKRHVGSMNRNSPADEDVFRFLKLMAPVLDMRQRVFMDKVVNIIDILRS